MSPFAGKEVHIFSVNDNGESGRLAKSLKAAPDAAGLNVSIANRGRYEDTPQRPVVIYVPPGEDQFLNVFVGYLASKGKIKDAVPVRKAGDQGISIWIAPR